MTQGELYMSALTTESYFSVYIPIVASVKAYKYRCIGYSATPRSFNQIQRNYWIYQRQLFPH